MKKLLWLPFAVLLVLFSCSSEPSFKVRFRIEGENVDGQRVRIAMLDDNVPRFVDSTVVKGNEFVLRGKVQFPDFYLVYIGNNGPVELFLENSRITVDCSIDSLSQAEVRGSASHDLFTSFFEGMEPYMERIQAARASLSEATVPLTDSQRDSVYAGIDNINKDLRKSMLDFFRTHNNSVVSPFLLNHTLLRELPLNELKPIVDQFAPEIKDSRHTLRVREYLDMKMRTVVGAQFTDFAMSDTTGNPVKLSDYVGKGKYVLMDVWAAWCAPCRAANPTLVALYNKYRSRNFEIVGVSLDRERAAWLKGIRDDKLTWPQMSDVKFWQSEVVELYDINTIPFAILFDPEGKVLYYPISASELEKVLADLLK